MKNLDHSTMDEERAGKNSYKTVYYTSYPNLVILNESTPNGDINRCIIPRVLLCLLQTLYQSPGKDALPFRCKNEQSAKSLMDRSRSGIYNRPGRSEKLRITLSGKIKSWINRKRFGTLARDTLLHQVCIHF